MKNRKDIERKEKAIRYIDSQISQLNDGYLIEYLIKMKKEIQKDLGKTPQKRYRESLFIDLSKNPRKNRTDSNISVKNSSEKTEKKQKIKDKPKKFLKRTVFNGIIAGVILGIPAGTVAYNYANNLPSSHNYITVGESRKGITDRKDHDSSNYKKYLIEKYNLTEEQADEKIQMEENVGKWER